MLFKKNRIVLVVLALILIVPAVLSGCKSNEEAVAKVNGELISKEAFDKYLDYQKKGAELTGNIAPDMWTNDLGDGQTYEEIIKKNVLEQLIVQEIIKQNAEEANVKVSNEELDKEVEKLKGTEEEKKSFEEFIEQMDITEDFFKEMYRSEMLISKYIEETVEVSEEEAKSYYEERKDIYDRVRARHILLETEEEAKDVIKSLNEGADFVELAKEKSIGPTGPNGGDLGYFSKGRMLPAFEEVAFNLEVGKISEPVKSDYGYHVIKVEDKKMTFEANKEDVMKDMKSSKFGEELKELRDAAEVEILLKEEPKEEPKDEENKESNDTDVKDEPKEDQNNDNKTTEEDAE